MRGPREMGHDLRPIARMFIRLYDHLCANDRRNSRKHARESRGVLIFSSPILFYGDFSEVPERRNLRHLESENPSSLFIHGDADRQWAELRIFLRDEIIDLDAVNSVSIAREV